MKREIRFKGLRTDGKGWAYGDLIHGVKHKNGKTYILPDNIQQEGCHHLDGFEVVPESVSQFTGHNDKNGVEIYEGDILSSYRGKRIVEYTPSDGIKLAIIYDEPLNGISQTHEDFRYNSTSISSVIGNMHTTPELLNPSNK